MTMKLDENAAVDRDVADAQPAGGEETEPLDAGLVAVEGEALEGEAAERCRSKTMSRKEMSRDLRRRRALGIVDVEEADIIREVEASRPRNRGDCISAQRPCMYVSCKHHLYLDVNPRTGSIKLNFPDKEIWELPNTCALDVADRGGITLEEVGAIMNLTRERIRQVETRGLYKLRVATEGGSLEQGELND